MRSKMRVERLVVGRKNDADGSCAQSGTSAHKGNRKILIGAKSS